VANELRACSERSVSDEVFNLQKMMIQGKKSTRASHEEPPQRNIPLRLVLCQRTR